LIEGSLTLSVRRNAQKGKDEEIDAITGANSVLTPKQYLLKKAVEEGYAKD